jgi:hypothetical protein
MNFFVYKNHECLANNYIGAFSMDTKGFPFYPEDGFYKYSNSF